MIRLHRPGLRARAMLALGTTALVLSAALAVLTYELTRSRLLDEREAAAQTQAYSNARIAQSTLRAESPDIPGLLDSIQRGSGSVVMLRFQSDWFTSAVGFGQNEVPSALRKDVVDASSAANQRVRISGTPYLAVGVPLQAAQAQYFEFVPLGELDKTLSEMARALVLAAAITTVAGSVVGLWISRRVLRPLRRVASTAAGISSGAHGARLEGEGDPDLEPLVASFNGMVDALEERAAREARFASDVSHEMRAPIAAMTAAIDVAKRHADDPEQFNQAVDILENRLAGFRGFVEDLLEMSRLEAGTAQIDLSPVEPRHLVESVLADDGHDVPVRVEPTVPSVVNTDPRRVGQILRNLVLNAERYAGGATLVRVTASERGRLRISVEDHGPGVASEERERIFQRFERGTAGQNAGQGTGLGLALVSEHTRLLGGSVWVEDNPGGGSRFVVELPADA